MYSVSVFLSDLNRWRTICLLYFLPSESFVEDIVSEYSYRVDLSISEIHVFEGKSILYHIKYS